MQSTWKIRLVFALFALAASVYFLYPSFVYFSLSEQQLKEVRSNKNAFSKYLPSWAPSDHIVPGLDLQGGTHIVLGVDLDKAISDKTNRTADRLKDFAESQKAVFSKVEFMSSTGEAPKIRVSFDTEQDIGDFEKNVLKQFGELQILSQTTKDLILKLDPNFVSSIKRDAVDQSINTIRTRIDKIGVTEPSISRRGTDQVQVQLPGYDNPEEAKSLIGRTAQLEFQMCNDDSMLLTELKDLPAGVELVKSGYSRPGNSSGKDIYLQFPENKLEEVKAYLAGKVPSDLVIKYGKMHHELGAVSMVRTYTLDKKIQLTGDDLVDARVTLGAEGDPRPHVGMTFSPTGARIFDELTAKSVGKRMAIVLEDWVDSAPVINQRISGGSASISMGGSRSRDEMLRDANQLALVLKSGALPAPVTFREERSVGPSLGEDAVKHAQTAFWVGTLLIVLFMAFYYKKSGFISIIGVLFNVAFIMATLSLLGATITLPSIAGLLLTIGMAVDANVIINERIREELRHGKMARAAVSSGYNAAFSAVIDTHVTTFISGIILWQYGTGPIQNFATMLLIGSVFSVITAVFFTRIFFDMMTAKNPQTISI